MASVPLIQKIIYLKLQAESEVAETAFDADVVEVEVVPTAGDEKSVTTLDGTRHTDLGPTAYALRLVLVQDWDSSRPGLARYLWDHRGESCAFAYNAHAAAWGTTPGYTGTVSSIVPPPYGGEGNEFVTRELVMPIDGEPAIAETDPYGA